MMNGQRKRGAKIQDNTKLKRVGLFLFAYIWGVRRLACIVGEDMKSEPYEAGYPLGQNSVILFYKQNNE